MNIPLITLLVAADFYLYKAERPEKLRIVNGTPQRDEQ
jgi:hypothetical protein